MSRPTYKLTINQDDIKALEIIKSNSSTGSVPYRRCAVVLDCGSGLSGKEIAARYDVTPNMVINWRRRYETGGVDGLLKDAPKPGRRGSNGVALSERVSAVLEQDSNPEGANWTSAKLSKHLNAPLSSVQRTLRQMGITLGRRHQWEIELSSELNKMRAEMAGLYLLPDIQVLALAVSPVELNASLSSGVMVTVNGKAARRLDVTDKKGGVLSLTQALQSLSELSERRSGVRNAQRVDAWLGTLEAELKRNGFTLYALIHAPEPTAITNGLTVRMLEAGDTETWLNSAGVWLNLLDPDGEKAPGLLAGMQKWIDTASDESEPFIWRTGCCPAPEAASCAATTPAQGNVLKVSLEYTDADGTKLNCTREFNNVVPQIGAYGQTASRAEYTELIGRLEQGVLGSTQQVARAFMNASLQMPGAAETEAGVEVKKKSPGV